ncbi:hypothetical protein [Methylobacterium sp. B1]|uniref:hypothetical protein n=1 Tax=Methylobacterium sp. B1 TaxID=91459 RepID=UPI0011D2C168|nr:hypothetical protein [Methylobacterium sp. B1]
MMDDPDYKMTFAVISELKDVFLTGHAEQAGACVSIAKAGLLAVDEWKGSDSSIASKFRLLGEHRDLTGDLGSAHSGVVERISNRGN